MQPALYFHALADNSVECRLCAHYCRLQPGQTGRCRVRHNVAGRLMTSAYDQPVLLAVEPIEKKYLFHAFPGSQTLSLGTPGCTMGCQYCINWRVSQRGVAEPVQPVPPAQVIDNALAEAVDGIAFTYTEPSLFLEYMLDIAALARRAGLFVVAKSNGYMTPAVLKEMARWLDAINIDLKGWNQPGHYRVTGARLAPVLANLTLARQLGLWLEVSTLVVPGLNDAPDDLHAMARFIAAELGPETPWHIQRFFPHYKMLAQPPTPQAKLSQAVAAGRQAGLHYIYAKELERGEMFQTRCPACQTVVLRRDGYRLAGQTLLAGSCPHCGRAIAGVGLGDKDFSKKQEKNRV